jgi:Domain of Unknown Function (DUF928)
MIKRLFLQSCFVIVTVFSLLSINGFNLALSVAKSPPTQPSRGKPLPTKSPTRPATQSRIRFQPPPPPDPGEPDDRGQGGGSRGPCRQYEALTALLPITDSTTPWGLTVSERPTVWVYAPAGFAANVPMDFVLRDRQNNAVYKTSFKSTELPTGVIRLTIPAQIKLTPNQSYRWSLAIYCDAAEPDTPKVVRGKIYRSTPSPQLNRELMAAITPLKKAQIYADNGIWYDALTTLGMAIAENQDAAEVKTAWAELLTQQKLPAAVPIRPCCTLK